MVVPATYGWMGAVIVAAMFTIHHRCLEQLFWHYESPEWE
jgi:hypothetical protein